MDIPFQYRGWRLKEVVPDPIDDPVPGPYYWVTYDHGNVHLKFRVRANQLEQTLDRELRQT